MFSQGWSLSGLSLPSLLPAGAKASQDSDNALQIVDGVQLIRSTLQPGRYPAITVQAATPVKWVIDAPQGSINGCNGAIYIPEYDIEYAFKPGENIIEFTPERSGQFRYSCWMGMIRGTITVSEPEPTAS
jgi:plastocyanin domain-containing protein